MTMYDDQDRGNTMDYARYLAGMDSIVVEKVASASAYFFEKPGHAIVDVGMASGTSTYILALLFPNTPVIGVDINPKMVQLASQTYHLPNLRFIVDDGETLEQLTHIKINGFFNCSSIHHITSFNDYNPNKAYLTLKRQAELLCDGGVLIVRDFVKPEAKEVIIEFPSDEEGRRNARQLISFAASARSLSAIYEQGFPLQKIKTDANDLSFRLNLEDAVEFIRRKDYLDDWDIELQEEYGYFSQHDFEETFANLGLRAIVSYPIYNSWIIRNRYSNKFELFDVDGKKRGIPPTNYVIAGEKATGKGTKLKPVRKLPIQKDSFLKMKTFKNTTSGQVFDIVQRPGSVVDILPYYRNQDDRLKILAKHGYPRPIINQITPVLDGKTYSGYITEGITGMIHQHIDEQLITSTLQERVNMKEAHIHTIHEGLTYYTSPGAINEKVNAVTVELSGINVASHESLGSFSGFQSSGVIRELDALQLINSAQVGALPEARLEMNTYHLLHKLNIHPGKWLNEPLTIKTVSSLNPIGLHEIYLEPSQLFEETTEQTGFLSHQRLKYYEYGQSDSNAIFEHIEPADLSSNTVITLPVCQYHKQLYLGIEKRNLPVPQLQEGSSLLLAAPAYRLPKDITNLSELKSYLLHKDVFGSQVVEVSKLGEKYLPCAGLTPEQVYPYVVTLESMTEALHWIALDDLLNNIENLRDGHLLISLFRLSHYVNQLADEGV